MKSELIVIAIAVVVANGWLFGGRGKKPARSSAAKGAERSELNRNAYASILENGRYRSLSSDEVAELFASFRQKIVEHSADARKLTKLSERFFDTGKIDEGSLSSLANADLKAKDTLAAINALYDQLFFETEKATERWWKVVESVDEAQADIEEAFRSIADTRQMITDGEYD